LLTEGRDRVGTALRVDGVESGGGEERSLRSRRWRAPRSPDLLWRPRGVPANAWRGQEGSEMASGEQSRRRVDLPRRKPGRNSRACVAEVEDGCLGVDPGSKTELAGGFSGARALRCGGFTVAQGCGAAEQGKRGGAGFWRRL
jgi:hypothetical protein